MFLRSLLSTLVVVAFCASADVESTSARGMTSRLMEFYRVGGQRLVDAFPAVAAWMASGRRYGGLPVGTSA